MSNVLGIGPFFGDFKSELLYFRPFVDWIKYNIPHEYIFINTHFNRHFLYNADKTIFFSIFEHLTRHEFLQKDIIHKEILQKDFLTLKKKFQKNISNYCNIKKSDPIILNLNYQQSNKLELTHRLFTQIEFTSYNINEKDYIVFIPDYQENIKITENVYNYLKERYNVIIIGDLKIHLPEKNIIIQKNDYFRNNYRWILSYMKNAKCIVCPGSHWTILSNLQKYPVISWSKIPGLYRDTYRFENEKSHSFMYDKTNNIEHLYKFLDRSILNYI